MAQRMSDKPQKKETPEEVVVEVTEPYISPNALVRARHPDSGDEYTTTLVLAQKANAEVLNKPAVDRYGRRIPRKIRTNLEGARA